MGVKQNVPNNANETKSMKFSKLRGVDYSSSPFEVSTSRAVHSKNMINEDGVNHKRKGWTTDLHINYSLGENMLKKFKIIDVFKCGNKYILTVQYDDGDTRTYILDNLNKVFDFNNSMRPTLYDYKKIKLSENEILIDGTVVSYNPSNGKIDYGSTDYYIPTTSISINSVEDEISGATPYEERNLLTCRRKNSMIGKHNETVKVTFRTMNTDSYIASVSIADGYYIDSNRVEYDMGLDSNRVYNKEVSFRVIPGWYVISAALDDYDGYDILCDENGNKLGDEGSTNKIEITIEKDIVIYIKEG